MEYEPGIFSGAYETELGQEIWGFLNDSQNILKMETACQMGKPAVEPLSESLLERFGEKVQDNRVKQMIGHMVKQILLGRNYIIHSQNSRVSSGGLFNKGTTYIKLRKPLEDQYRHGYVHGAMSVYSAIKAHINRDALKPLSLWMDELMAWETEGLLNPNSRMELPPKFEVPIE